MECNIIIVEDDRLHGETLSEMLSEIHGHKVRLFRDRRTLEEAIDTAKADGTPLFPEVNPERPLVVILDIMLAEELDPELDESPRWRGEGEPSEDERKHHVDDRLGLDLAYRMREGAYAPVVPSKTPLLFFTARRNFAIQKEATSPDMQPAVYLNKPMFTDDVEKAIHNLVSTCQCVSTEKKG